MNLSDTAKAVCPSPSRQYVCAPSFCSESRVPPPFSRMKTRSLWRVETASFREFKLDNLSAHKLSLFRYSTGVRHHVTNHFIIGHTEIALPRVNVSPLRLFVFVPWFLHHLAVLGLVCVCVCVWIWGNMALWPHLNHIELGDAVLLHTHGHGDAVLLDKHGESWRRGTWGLGRRLTREGGREGQREGRGRGDRRDSRGLLFMTCQITSWSPHWWFLWEKKTIKAWGT